METIGLIITIAFIVLIFIALLLLWEPIKKLIIAKSDEVKYTTLTKYVKESVGWAEQWLWGDVGSEKRKRVIAYISGVCKEKGWTFTEEDIEKVLENAVKKIKEDK